MSRTIEYLKELRLDNAEHLEEYISKSTTEELIGFIQYMRKLIEEDYVKKTHNPFTFVPNDDLSGAGGCSDLECKLKRATRFAVFSSLYADDVYIQLNFITEPHCDFEDGDAEVIDNNDDKYFEFRYDLQCDIMVLNVYSKLIEANIVHIQPPKEIYCKDCFQELVLGLKNPIDINPIKRLIVDRLELEIYDYDKELNSLTFQAKNIDEFFAETGVIFTMKKSILDKIPMSDRRSGMIIQDKTIVNGFIDGFVEEEFISSCYYASYCKGNDAKFITTKISDGMLMGLTRQEVTQDYGFDYFRKIPKYDLPFVSQITIDKALHLREIEGESFNKYRIALNSAIKEQCKTNSRIDWRQINDDILYPAFNDLDIKLKNIKGGIYRKTFSQILIFGTVISAGLYTGIIPNDINSILKSIGIGTGASISVGNQIIGTSTGKQSLRENDYYFLWTLKKDLDRKLKI